MPPKIAKSESDNAHGGAYKSVKNKKGGYINIYFLGKNDESDSNYRRC